MPRFTIRRDGAPIESLELTGDDFLIGRLPGVDIQLDDPTVSRRHARVRRKGAEWIVEDCASLNGFRVDGVALRRHVLAAGDEIQVESHAVVFEPPDSLFQAGLHAGRRGSEEESALERTMIHLARPAAPPRPDDDPSKQGGSSEPGG